jgi:hypothetical protein
MTVEKLIIGNIRMIYPPRLEGHLTFNTESPFKHSTGSLQRSYNPLQTRGNPFHVSDTNTVRHLKCTYNLGNAYGKRN